MIVTEIVVGCHLCFVAARGVEVCLDRLTSTSRLIGLHRYLQTRSLGRILQNFPFDILITLLHYLHSAHSVCRDAHCFEQSRAAALCDSYTEVTE